MTDRPPKFGPDAPPEYFAAVVADAIRTATDAAYVAGRLKSTMEAHIRWLEGARVRLSEKGITAEMRRLILDNEIGRLREVLEEAWISRA